MNPLCFALPALKSCLSDLGVANCPPRSDRTLLGAPGLATRHKDATRITLIQFKASTKFNGKLHASSSNSNVLSMP